MLRFRDWWYTAHDERTPAQRVMVRLIILRHRVHDWVSAMRWQPRVPVCTQCHHHFLEWDDCGWFTLKKGGKEQFLCRFCMRAEGPETWGDR